VHKKAAEFVYIIKGKAKAYLRDKIIAVSSGDYLVIPPGVRHRFVTGKKPLVALSVFCPSMNSDNQDAVMCESSGNEK
jgi:mannose-6-phosphate isomerase-like protein (cupin superfamily)